MSLYNHHTEVHNTVSAKQVVPFIYNLIKPNSVVDLGCGLGSWLKIFNKYGVQDILGINAISIPESQLKISPHQIKVCDLNKPITLKNTFDLAISLETAEHLLPESAALHVGQLVQLSDWILFSAAVPGQGGQNHLNEQWPGYWQSLFQEHDYFFWDVLRPRFWADDKIFWWYRQNMFLVAKKSCLLAIDPKILDLPILPMIHPELQKLNIKQIKNLKEKRTFLGKIIAYFRSLFF